MKVLQKLLFTFAIVVGLSIGIYAQKDDQKKPPPKGNPPVVTPQPKNPPPKKPANALVVWKRDTVETV